MNIVKSNIQYRSIPIALLPDCYLKEWFTSICINPSQNSVIVVAKLDNLGGWVVYIGYPRLDEVKKEYRTFKNIEYLCTTISTTSQVEAYGDKLDESCAKMLFPEWEYRSYLK